MSKYQNDPYNLLWHVILSYPLLSLQGCVAVLQLLLCCGILWPPHELSYSGHGLHLSLFSSFLQTIRKCKQLLLGPDRCLKSRPSFTAEAPGMLFSAPLQALQAELCLHDEDITGSENCTTDHQTTTGRASAWKQRKRQLWASSLKKKSDSRLYGKMKVSARALSGA